MAGTRSSSRLAKNKSSAQTEVAKKTTPTKRKKSIAEADGAKAVAKKQKDVDVSGTKKATPPKTKKPTEDEPVGATATTTPAAPDIKVEAPTAVVEKREEVDVSESANGASERVVSVEACKQCGAFKTRALKIQKAVGALATVKINEEKPGRGNFVVRVDGREKPVVKLLGMKRPFPALKALDMDEIAEKVKKAL